MRKTPSLADGTGRESAILPSRYVSSHPGHEEHGHACAHGPHAHGAAARGHDAHAGHEHGRGAPAERLRAALLLTVGFLGVEFVAGVLCGSLALLSDAGHMLTDAGALGLALVAQRIADRPRTTVHTFGFRRAEILAALLNGAVLGVTAVWVIVEAVRRWRDPPDIAGGWMLAVASVGLFVNVAAAWVLGHGASASNANVRAAFTHVLADAAGSVAAMIAGGLIVAFGWRHADPVASILISLSILWGAFGLLRGSLGVLMETVPEGIVLAELEATVRETPGVQDAHDLHVWTISEGFPVVTVHVVLDGTAHGTDVARAVGERMRAHHHIDHVTVQPEAPPPGGRLLSPQRLARRSQKDA